MQYIPLEGGKKNSDARLLNNKEQRKKQLAFKRVIYVLVYMEKSLILVKWEYSVAADVLAPHVTRTSAAMVLTMQNERVLVFPKKGFQLSDQLNAEKW